MECRVCDGRDFRLVVDLGCQPRGNHFLTKEEVGQEPMYPLRLIYCNQCATAQLDYTVKKEIVNNDHSYLSGVTRSLRDHFASVAEGVDKAFFSLRAKKSALDIGSNDGTGLIPYQKLGYRTLGVEASSQLAKIANEHNVETLHAFFNLPLAESLGESFDVINAAGVFFHLEELHSVTQGIRYLLKPDGVFVIQAMYMKNILENQAFDQIYHEHLLFYTFKTLQKLLRRHGLELFDGYISPIHGGSIIGYAGHLGSRPQTERLKQLIQEEELADTNAFATYAAFASQLPRMKEENLSFLEMKKQEGKVIYGMGAPVKGNTLLNYFGIGTQYLTCLVEKNALRKGRFSPGMHVPIFMEDEVPPPDVYYVLAWNFKKEILANNTHLLKQGVEFYFPVDPERRFVTV
ncbi:MAG: class I SAM-dependent methyltransferase [Simkaniaceae bacterium]|nr:class I SAM-dependent methyltransferase [Simkaniaceae bacterium]